MLITLSPAKTLDFETESNLDSFTQPRMLEQSKVLNKRLRKLSKDDLQDLMSLSDDLTAVNHQRNRDWSPPFDLANAKQAILAFRGAAFTGLDADSYSPEDFETAQRSLRILSGLYGVLRPLDLIQAYRLEMGTKLDNPGGKNLYEFWDTSITSLINADLDDHNQRVIVNVASNEYFKSIKRKILDARVVTPVFKDIKDGKLRTIAAFAKPARGMMASYIIKNRLEDADGIKEFNEGGYEFDKSLSTEDEFVFTRPQP
ncbi:MAG TPA: peroxide stress protein YaaA [Planctomycetaceae bacterium]|nr:peroxide stress protein YaaA [Planctomycetaceae bacterium]